MKRFVKKVALVTGGSRGIGQAIARRLRDEGAHVFTAQRCSDGEFDSFTVDFSDPVSASRLVAQLIEKTGQLDVLVNNAGMMQEATVEDMSIEDWQRTMRVNLDTPFMLIKAALPHLRKTKGSIVNVGSIEGLGSNRRGTGLDRHRAQ
jgi:meso-butanediol dehydrogenase/(S,S)-butanediol dehydrogenase/diacetyl reductase